MSQGVATYIRSDYRAGVRCIDAVGAAKTGWRTIDEAGARRNHGAAQQVRAKARVRFGLGLGTLLQTGMALTLTLTRVACCPLCSAVVLHDAREEGP